MKTLNKPRYAAGTVHSGINESIMSALQKNKLMTEVEIDQSLVHVPEYLGGGNLKRLRAFLRHLQVRNLIHSVETAIGRKWAAGRAPVVKPEGPAITPARMVNVMHGPIYVPRPMGSTRPGAMDYKSLPSRGHAC